MIPVALQEMVINNQFRCRWRDELERQGVSIFDASLEQRQTAAIKVLSRIMDDLIMAELPIL